jgi:acetyl-CoA synthetase
MIGAEQSEELRAELVAWVRKDIGPIASPDIIHFATGLPKTRSGKIMRRLLRDVAENRSMGDVSTLQDSTVMDLIAGGMQAGKSDED